MSDVLEAAAPAAPDATPGAPFEPQVLALICERSVPIDEMMGSDERLAALPNVHVLRFPCSGMIKPSLAQLALDEGWDGVVVTGCGVGDCHFREGNFWARERFLGDRAPNKFRRMEQQRVALVWKAASEPDEFLAEVRTFLRALQEMPPNVRKTDAKSKKRER